MDEHKECYNYVDILIHFKELKIAADKIKLIDTDFDTSFLEKQKEYLDKLMKVLDISNINEQGEQGEQGDSFPLINTMSKLTTVVENNNMSTAVFDNFGNGLANLLKGGVKSDIKKDKSDNQETESKPIKNQPIENQPIELTTVNGIKISNVKLPKEILERHFLIKK